MAASDERPREQYDGDKAYFTAAKADTGTVFSIIENDDGAYSFHYARRIMQDEELLGVVVVTVDLGAARGGLAAGAGQGGGHRQRRPGAARLRAELAAEDAVEPARPRPRPLAGPPGDPRRAAELRRALLRLHRRHAAPARRGAGRLPQLAAHLLRHARGRARAGERDPVADHHGAGAAAGARLLPAVAADPRREPAHPARVRGAAGAEPAALGRDRRAQAGGDEPQGGRAEPRAGLEARRARPDVGRGQPRAEPAARGDEDLSRRRAAAPDPPAAGGGAVARSSASTT